MENLSYLYAKLKISRQRSQNGRYTSFIESKIDLLLSNQQSNCLIIGVLTLAAALHGLI